METLIYFLIFMMGAYIGSFASLAIYRLPLKQDILYTHSYCPNCKNKLKILDMIPIFSYIFLKGKCRNCGEKIRIRYLLLEILSGICVLLFFISNNLDLATITLHQFIIIITNVIFFTTLILIAGIDKENRLIQKNLLVFGTIIQIIYMIWLNSFTVFNIISIIFLIMLLFIKKPKYYIQIVELILYTLFFMPVNVTILAFIAVTLLNVINIKDIKKLNIGFLYIIILLIIFLINNFILNY